MNRLQRDAEPVEQQALRKQTCGLGLKLKPGEVGQRGLKQLECLAVAVQRKEGVHIIMDESEVVLSVGKIARAARHSQGVSVLKSRRGCLEGHVPLQFLAQSVDYAQLGSGVYVKVRTVEY